LGGAHGNRAGLPPRVMDIAVLCQVLYLLGLVKLERSLLE